MFGLSGYLQVFGLRRRRPVGALVLVRAIRRARVDSISARVAGLIWRAWASVAACAARWRACRAIRSAAGVTWSHLSARGG
ncbi:hypothetical protein Ae331Ps2_6385 [Pseudonocardia sp. Ae331_Ps2]|nr:hypothetical protein Ae331Ps2_6385 [Pseudonocardia sp. Ae331_Ps2]